MTIELKGCILVPEGWRRGTLRFSQRIKAVLGAPVAAPAADEPRILPGFVDLHVHGGGGCDVMDGDGAVEWFVDGSKTATKLSGGTEYEPDRTRDSLFVGARHAAGERFVGSMAEIWILNRPMSDDWIRLQAACRTPGSGLVKIRR